jgi:UDP-N-acetylmuramate-alanine ligase
MQNTGQDDIRMLGEDGIEYNLSVEKDKSTRLRLNAPGRHNVYNSLAAIAAGRVFGMDMNGYSIRAAGVCQRQHALEYLFHQAP